MSAVCIQKCVLNKIIVEITTGFVYTDLVVVFATIQGHSREVRPSRKEFLIMYTVNSIRNICLLGHSGSGKSALAESLRYMTGAIVRMGKNADGNTVSDIDPEET